MHCRRTNNPTAIPVLVKYCTRSAYLLYTVRTLHATVHCYFTYNASPRCSPPLSPSPRRPTPDTRLIVRRRHSSSYRHSPVYWIAAARGQQRALFPKKVTLLNINLIYLYTRTHHTHAVSSYSHPKGYPPRGKFSHARRGRMATQKRKTKALQKN